MENELAGQNTLVTELERQVRETKSRTDTELTAKEKEVVSLKTVFQLSFFLSLLFRYFFDNQKVLDEIYKFELYFPDDERVESKVFIFRD